MAEFIDEDLTGSRFERVDLSDSTFRRVRLSRALIRDVGMRETVLTDVEMIDCSLDGHFEGSLVINGVDVLPYLDAELDRRDPLRPKMRPTDPAGFREAWDILERLWDATVERARTFPPGLLHESVDGEWSFIETLRHLVFATDAWVRRGILGDPAPWDPLDLPWDQMPDTPGIPRDREVRPSLDEVLALRLDRMSTVRTLVDEATEEWLDSHTQPVEGPGWPPPESFPVRECLLTVLNEEFLHRKYAERDLDFLETGVAPAG